MSMFIQQTGEPHKSQSADRKYTDNRITVRALWVDCRSMNFIHRVHTDEVR